MLNCSEHFLFYFNVITQFYLDFFVLFVLLNFYFIKDIFISQHSLFNDINFFYLCNFFRIDTLVKDLNLVESFLYRHVIVDVCVVHNYYLDDTNNNTRFFFDFLNLILENVDIKEYVDFHN